MSRREYIWELVAFAITAAAALVSGWKANELCWGWWISSLLTGWVVLLASVVRALVYVMRGPVPDASNGSSGDDPLSGFFTERLFAGPVRDRGGPPRHWPAPVVSAAIVLLGAFTWFHFTFFHLVLATLMSVFVRMEPAEYFGPNGFINANIGDVGSYLVRNYWAMIVGTLLLRREHIAGGNAGANMKAIYRTVGRMHLFILLSAGLFFLAPLGVNVYNSVTLVVLLFLFYFPFPLLRRRAS